MRYRALLTDFDGCLAGQHLEVSERVTQALAALPAETTASIVTGRRFAGPIEQTVGNLEIHGPHVLNDGALLYDSRTQKILWQRTIAPERARAALALVIQEQREVFVEDGWAAYTNVADQERVRHHDDCQPLDALPYRDIMKISIRTGESLQAAEHLERRLAKQFSDLRVCKWHIPYFQSGGVDIVAATKLEGVTEYLKHTGLKPEEVVTVGDGYNDFPFLMAGGLKIAMGNAVEDLKAIADYVAPSVDEDGIAWVIEKFFLSP